MFLKPPAAVIGIAAPTSHAAFALIALALAAPFVLYFGTAQSIVQVWNSSETFAHGYAILPISLWLVWRRRENFTLYPPQPWPPGLALLALAGAAWLAASVGEVQVVKQYAFVAMLPLAALTLLGPRLAGSLAFPLLFLLFAVPFGEVFVDPLIQFTADFTVAAVRASGIPVLRTGTRFELPTGLWSVVEACSGVRYLISSVTLGSLYAYLTYRSPVRRAAFVALSVVVPILANGLRAYMIVMIGHTSNMELATGVDHLVYGWLFFGLVMFIMFWIGSYWREEPRPAALPKAGAIPALPAPTARVAATALAVVLVAGLWPAYANLNERMNANPRAVRLAAPPVSWPAAPEVASWQPRFLAPSARYESAFRGPAGQAVGVKMLYYRNQDGDKALVSSVNRITGPKDAWHETASARRVEAVGGREFALRESLLEGPEGRLVVWHWMWIGGQATASNVAGKLLQARSKMLFAGDDGAAVMLTAPWQDTPEQARAALRAFLGENLGAIDTSLVNAREH